MSTTRLGILGLAPLLVMVCVPAGAVAQASIVSQLAQASQVQALHYRQYGYFSISTNWLSRVVGGLVPSHYYAMAADRSHVLMYALPRHSQGFAYVAGVFVNSQEQNVAAVVCQSNQPGRNLPPRPGLTTDSRGRVVAACRVGSTQVSPALYF